MQINQGGAPDKQSIMQAIMARLGAGDPNANAGQPLAQPPGADLYEAQRAAGLGPIQNAGYAPGAHVDQLAGGFPQQGPVEGALHANSAPMRQALARRQAEFSGQTQKLSPEEMAVILQQFGGGQYQVK